jgi:hypothetical protein
VKRSHKKLDDWRETMALLKILALGNRQIESGKVERAAHVIKRLHERNNSANVFGRDAE